jgi:hypothetical protein
MKKLYVFLILLCGLLPVSAGAKESSIGVVISEINWAGSASSNADEWLELYNGSSETVDLGGWILAGAATSGDALAIEEGTELGVGEVLLISNYAAGSEKSTLTVERSLVTSNLSLSNSGLEIYLAMADGTVVDQVNDQVGSSNPFVSMERDLETLEWLPATESMNLNDTDQLGTPGFVEETEVEEFEESEVVEGSDTAASSSVEEVTSTTDACMYDIAVLQDEIEQLEALLALAVEPQIDEESVWETDESGGKEPEEVTEEAEESEQEEKVEEEAIEASPIPYQPKDVLINEFVSNPEDGTEWIELLFMKDVDLDGWTVVDDKGKTTMLEGVYEAEDFLVIESPKGQLNNGGDSVLLYDGTEQLIDSITYGEDRPAPEKGEALARTLDNEWALTTNLTPGERNMFPVIYTEQVIDQDSTDEEEVHTETESEVEINDTEEEITHIVVDIAEVAEENVNTDGIDTEDDVAYVGDSASGVVTALPGTFGKQIAFIGGQQLYFYHADWPELALGDVVSVSGEFSTARGESRLKISSAEDIVVTGSEDLEPHDVDISTIATIEDGTLVRVHGSYISRDGDRLTIEDDTGSLIVFAHANSGISWSHFQSSELAIIGIVRTVDGETRLYPRSVEDVVEVIEEEARGASEYQTEGFDGAIGATVNDTTEWGPWIGGTIVSATGAVLAYWFVKYRSDINSQPISV